GDVVRRKSGPSLLQAKRSRIKAVMRRDLTKAESYAAEHDISVATDNANKVIQDPEIDLIYVATPPSSHKDYTVASAKEGKDVVVEKPVGLNSKEAREMVEACKGEGVELFVAYYRRFYHQVRKIKELIDSGEIGKPVQSYVYISFDPPEEAGWREKLEVSGGGWFVDVASHRVDLLTFLLGSVEEATGVVTSFDTGNELEDTVTLSLKFDSGAQAGVQGDFFTDHSADELYVHGTEGTIFTTDLGEPRVNLRTQAEEKKFKLEELPATHYGLFEHVEKVLLDGESNRASGADALITEKVLDKTIRSYY
ncbi:Gfo/Idh/MocA family oxidoreductase, partial [Candidatus Bipolaricaulota bacterium]|nr:Gfo/Idh/MocA family oxidoreductase [Candidatus Bipolaricaulota bacterium]